VVVDFAYRVKVAKNTWLRVEETAAPLEFAITVAFRRAFHLRNIPSQSALRWNIAADVLQSMPITFLNSSGKTTPIGNVDIEKFHQPAIAANRVCLTTAEQSWVISVRHLFDGMAWILERPTCEL